MSTTAVVANTKRSPRTTRGCCGALADAGLTDVRWINVESGIRRQVGSSEGIETRRYDLFASGLKLPTEIDDIVDAIARGDRRSIDTALCNDRTFNVIAGTGFGVAMLNDAEDTKERLGTLAYVGAAVRTTRQRKMFDAKIDIDGARVL